MNLIIDVGNTLVKLAVFNSGELVYKKSIEKNNFHTLLNQIAQQYSSIQRAIVSSVGNFTEGELQDVKLQHILSFQSL